MRSRLRSHLRALEQKKLLRNGKLNEVLATLRVALAGTPVTGPGNKFHREVLAETINHFVKN